MLNKTSEGDLLPDPEEIPGVGELFLIFLGVAVILILISTPIALLALCGYWMFARSQSESHQLHSRTASVSASEDFRSDIVTSRRTTNSSAVQQWIRN